MGAWWGVGGAESALNIIIWVGVSAVCWKLSGLM
jgi:hypothetical protein